MNWFTRRMSLSRRSSFCSRGRIRRTALAAAIAAIAPIAAGAEPIRHPTAIFAGLDKTTGRIINFEVAIDETVQFGALQVTPRVCNTRPQTEAPQTTSFVEVDETVTKSEAPRDAKGHARNEVKTESKRIFSGWMFAASPGLHGVEHPVYDVWLTDCKGGKEVVAAPVLPPESETATDQGAAEAAAPPDATAADSRRRSRRSRRVEPVTPTPIEPQPIGPPDQPAPALQGAPDAAASAQTPADQAGAKPKKKRKPAAQSADPGAAAPRPSSPSLFPF
jgi:hypothetical protein